MEGGTTRREPGLEAAVRACGGVGELARRLGLSEPLVAHWQRVPAERVLAVESVSGVPRRELRPDLYPGQEAADPLDELRARHWSLLSLLLARPPDRALLCQLAALSGDDTPLGAARGALAEAAREADPVALEREFHDLFIGLGRGELLPYASYYLTGFLHERPLAKVRAEMERLGIARNAGCAEPEDHIATLAEIMAGLLRGEFGDGEDEAKRFLSRHLAPWAATFFSDLERAEHARFYRAVGRFGSVFVAIETEAVTLPA